MSRTGNKERWVRPLLAWFDRKQREMPWRSEPTPYRVWISEIMLQQTQVVSVIPYFTRFLERFPTLESLARAPLQPVLKAWEGLGYYSRARNLHRAAQVMMAEHGGRVPDTFEALLRLPGVGRYTAAAVASIAFGEAVPVVDGNVLRVMARLLDSHDDIALPATRDRVFAFLKAPVESSGDPSRFNQAMMELGALVCVPRSPRCEDCPVVEHCLAKRRGTAGQRPVKGSRKALRHDHIGVGLVFDAKGRLLIARRKADGLLGGLWEFPGGKRLRGETLRQTTVREVREETGLDVEILRALPAVEHAYSHFQVTLHPFICRRLAGRARALGSDEVRWVKPAELKDYPFPAANRKIERALFTFLR